MSKLTLYVYELSGPSRSVRLLVDYMHLELDIENVDIFKGEQLEESYLKLNPQHTVPTLVDDGESIWDSHAISTYLVTKYGEDDLLYPQDVLARARVDQRLHFDSNLFAKLQSALHPVLLRGERSPPGTLDALSSSLNMLETFLGDQSYVCGDTLTVADIILLTTVATAQVLVPLDPELHEKILAWMDLLSSQLPTYDEYVTQITEKYHAMVAAKACDGDE